MYKVVISTTVTAFPIKNGECVPPQVAQEQKIKAFDVETVEEAREQIKQYYSEAQTWLN